MHASIKQTFKLIKNKANLNCNIKQVISNKLEKNITINYIINVKT